MKSLGSYHSFLFYTMDMLLTLSLVRQGIINSVLNSLNMQTITCGDLPGQAAQSCPIA